MDDRGSAATDDVKMPLIILCGQPSSGKSGVALAIQKQLCSTSREVTLISEQTLHQDRNAAYKGTQLYRIDHS